MLYGDLLHGDDGHHVDDDDPVHHGVHGDHDMCDDDCCDYNPDTAENYHNIFFFSGTGGRSCKEEVQRLLRIINTGITITYMTILVMIK